MSSLRGAGTSYRRNSRTVQAAPSAGPTKSYGLNAVMLRPAVLGLAKLCFLPLVSAAPLLRNRSVHVCEDDNELPKDSPDIWAYLSVAIALVLLGGAFAGLTIALMGQDETYLQVIATSGEGKERKHAQKVLDLLQKGKHWVLVTLLLSNVITNETLPIVLDRSLGGGWPAVVSSTVLIVIFGEIAPQSVCVRYGLSIGAFMAPCVLALMWILAPVAWPTAKLLDYMLGEDHGTSYSKPGLKTLVQLHRTLGASAADRLLEDEVTIISSVLDLKDKAVGDIMTPMQDVFTMSADTVLDEKMMDIILSQGYSRIPIYAPDNSRNFIGMLLVKILITYDPEDCKRVRDFALATLPETGPYTSCLDIINFFQEGKSHMVLVSDYPGQDKGATGVVTLEDVIEELIGEEIIDESDVFVDVHKAIRRMAPAPRTKYSKLFAAAESEIDGDKTGEDTPLLGKENGEITSRKPSLVNGQSTTFLMRRKSSNASDSTRDTLRPVPVRGSTSDLRKQLAHLGPSNMASKPRSTKFTSVKIKPGVGTIPEGQPTTTGIDTAKDRQRAASVGEQPTALGEGEGAGLLKDAGQDASGGVSALQAGYGTIRTPSRSRSRRRSTGEESFTDGGKAESFKMSPAMASKQAELNVKTPPAGESRDDSKSDYIGADTANKQDTDNRKPEETRNSPLKAATSSSPPRAKSGQSTPIEKLSRSPEDKSHLSPKDTRKYGDKLVVGPQHNADDANDDDTVGEMEAPSRDRSKNRRTARSGSITETTVDVNGMKKVVLETTSSSDDDNAAPASPKKIPGQDGAADVRDSDGKNQIFIKGESNTNGSGTASGSASATASVNGTPTGSSTGAAAQKKKKKKKSKKAKKDGPA